MADENLEEAMDGLAYELEDTFLEGLGDDAIRVSFRNLLMNSAFYTLSRRCGLEPMEYLEEVDFTGIMDFNKLSVLTFLGNATSQLVEPVLVDIGQTVRKIYLEEARDESEKTVAKENGIEYNEFNTLIRKSKNKNKQGGDLTIGKYGMLRRTYLKENRKNWYQSMMLTGKLNSHLMEIEKAAGERMEVLMKGLLERYPAPDKETVQMEWVAHMNSLMSMAEESILTELVYS